MSLPVRHMSNIGGDFWSEIEVLSKNTGQRFARNTMGEPERNQNKWPRYFVTVSKCVDRRKRNRAENTNSVNSTRLGGLGEVPCGINYNIAKYMPDSMLLVVFIKMIDYILLRICPLF